jgi:hypothetical protein
MAGSVLLVIGSNFWVLKSPTLITGRLPRMWATVRIICCHWA